MQVTAFHHLKVLFIGITRDIRYQLFNQNIVANGWIFKAKSRTKEFGIRPMSKNRQLRHGIGISGSNNVILLYKIVSRQSVLIIAETADRQLRGTECLSEEV